MRRSHSVNQSPIGQMIGHRSSSNNEACLGTGNARLMSQWARCEPLSERGHDYADICAAKAVRLNVEFRGPSSAGVRGRARGFSPRLFSGIAGAGRLFAPEPGNAGAGHRVWGWILYAALRGATDGAWLRDGARP